MHYTIYTLVVPMYDVSACARELFASPQTCFCILGHLHYHIMTRILYGLTTIAIILKSSLHLIYMYILYIIFYNVILRRSLCIYGFSCFLPKSTVPFTAKSVIRYYTFQISTKMEIQIFSSSQLFAYYKKLLL